jgi:tetratricopeptide (TPR) repeat protein
MRIRRTLFLLAVTLAAAPALASFSSDKPDKPASSPSSMPQATDAKPARQEAEKWYHDAYEDVTKAQEVLAEKKDTKKANKLFQRAIERAGRAIDHDKEYFEAYNLQGFAWRHLGDFEKSVTAYERCLDIKSDYAPAREYYGQTLLLKGDRQGAELQLVWLQRLKADDLAKQLEAAIAAAGPGDPAKSTAKADSGSVGGR